jgi:hypothetical protein
MKSIGTGRKNHRNRKWRAHELQIIINDHTLLKFKVLAYVGKGVSAPYRHTGTLKVMITAEAGISRIIVSTLIERTKALYT